MRLDRETREYLRAEIDRRRRVEIETPKAEPWTEATIVEAIRRFETEVGRTPTRSDFETGDHPLPSTRTVSRVYGSLAAALAAAVQTPTVEVEVFEQATLFEVG